MLLDSHKPWIFLSTDTLTCNKGIMVKLGSNFSKAPIEWKTFGTIESAPNEICQETVLLIDVGA